jgi:hypothetical protein
VFLFFFRLGASYGSSSSQYWGERGRAVTSGGFAPLQSSFQGGVNGTGGFTPAGAGSGGGAGWLGDSVCTQATYRMFCASGRAKKFRGGVGNGYSEGGFGGGGASFYEGGGGGGYSGGAGTLQ